MANEVALKKALEDEAFVKELAEMENPEEVRDALNAKGADITVEEVQAIGNALAKQAEGELDEDSLEDVAGGIAVTTAIAIGTIGVSLVIRAVRSRW